MVEVDIPQSLFEEQGRQLYGANLLEIQVLVTSCNIFRQSGNLDSTILYVYDFPAKEKLKSLSQAHLFFNSSYLA